MATNYLLIHQSLETLIPQTYLRQVAGSREEMIEAKCSPHCSFFVFGIKSREKGAYYVNMYKDHVLVCFFF